MVIRLLFIVSMSASGLRAFAYQPQEGNIFASFGPLVTQTNYQSEKDQPRSPIKLSGGMLVHGDINDRGSLEISIFHLNKTFFRTSEEQFSAESLEMIQVGMGYRHWLSSQLSFGVVLTSSYAMNNPQIVQKNPDGNLIETSARDVSEYGLDFSFQKLFLENEKSSFLFDLRYNRNFTSRKGENSDHYLVMFAYRYFIQGKSGPQP